ncbi:MAG: DUF1648 domain-containing protein [Streptococcaceae bacterium]|jgi:uncharacterized membrane protein|nr:DUF1648 domain-containing protein [Streptococcaceae bacterium]
MDRKFLISLAITLIPIIPILIFYQALPEQIAIHFDFAGNANGMMPKPFATFGLLVFFAALHVYCYMVKYRNTLFSLYVWIIPVLTNVVMLFIVFYSLMH